MIHLLINKAIFILACYLNNRLHIMAPVFVLFTTEQSNNGIQRHAIHTEYQKISHYKQIEWCGSLVGCAGTDFFLLNRDDATVLRQRNVLVHFLSLLFNEGVNCWDYIMSDVPNERMSMQHQLNDNEKGKPKNSLSQCHLVHHLSHMHCLGLNLWLCTDRLTTNCLSQHDPHQVLCCISQSSVIKTT
jgi:hypothetical protein